MKKFIGFLVAIMVINVLVTAVGYTNSKRSRNETVVETVEDENDYGGEIITYNGYNEKEKYASFEIKRGKKVYERRYFDNGEVIEIQTLK